MLPKSFTLLFLGHIFPFYVTELHLFSLSRSHNPLYLTQLFHFAHLRADRTLQHYRSLMYLPNQKPMKLHHRELCQEAGKVQIKAASIIPAAFTLLFSHNVFHFIEFFFYRFAWSCCDFTYNDHGNQAQEESWDHFIHEL
jgi:hypothetical protein